jgi:hypothetical protein
MCRKRPRLPSDPRVVNPCRCGVLYPDVVSFAAVPIVLGQMMRRVLSVFSKPWEGLGDQLVGSWTAVKARCQGAHGRRETKQTAL